jgi:hypothetical protein
MEDEDETANTVEPNTRSKKQTTKKPRSGKSNGAFQVLENNSGSENIADDLVESGSSIQIRKVFARYLDRLRRIYELDIQLVDQLGELLAEFDDEILPILETLLDLTRPLTNLIVNQETGNLNLVRLIGYIVQSLAAAEYEVSVSTRLKDLAFLNFRTYMRNLVLQMRFLRGVLQRPLTSMKNWEVA